MTDNDGWIDYDGSGMPVDENVIVNWRTLYWEYEDEAIAAGELDWSILNDGNDITKYRIVRTN